MLGGVSERIIIIEAYLVWKETHTQTDYISNSLAHALRVNKIILQYLAL